MTHPQVGNDRAMREGGRIRFGLPMPPALRAGECQG